MCQGNQWSVLVLNPEIKIKQWSIFALIPKNIYELFESFGASKLSRPQVTSPGSDIVSGRPGDFGWYVPLLRLEAADDFLNSGFVLMKIPEVLGWDLRWTSWKHVAEIASVFEQAIPSSKQHRRLFVKTLWWFKPVLCFMCESTRSLHLGFLKWASFSQKMKLAEISAKWVSRYIFFFSCPGWGFKESSD